MVPFKARPSKAPHDQAAPAAARERARIAAAHWPTAGQATLSPLPGTAAKGQVGGLPITITTPHIPSKAAKAAPADAPSVSVHVHDRKASQRAGVKGLLLDLTPKNSGAQAGPVNLSLNYSSFASMYGGSYGARLRLVQLPACALTTPNKPACQTRQPLPSKNDPTAQTLTADVPAKALASGMTVLAAEGDSSSAAGDFGATALGPSATWEAGGSTGDFSWNYPLRVPPATAGPAPRLSIDYNSGSVDGRTAAENNQTSVIGEGFSITESYIERKYASCKDDGNTGKGDLCWKYANATLVLNGKAAELVNDCDPKVTGACSAAALSEAAGGTWKLKNDDATKVEHLTGTVNDDTNGEYWRVTTTDGVQYYFGKHRLPGWSDNGTNPDDPVTNSVLTVPVFGDDAGEPCHGVTFNDSDCVQAWKWNLDYVVDTHGNAMTYWYGKESNYYAKSGVASPGTSYHRAGYLKRIDYGQRSDQLFDKPAAQQVTFTYGQRCVVEGGCTSLTDTTKKDWPDVPFDQICSSTEACTGLIGPSFFTRYRLRDVNTYVWTGTGTTMRQVDNWHLEQSFPPSGDASAPSLWLDSIQSTGKAGGTDAPTPKIVFGGSQLPNHVEGGGTTLRYIKWRVRTITTETGSVITVNYSDPECIRGTRMPASEDKNGLRCFPIKWSQAGGTPTTDWFHKYVVTDVFQEDAQGGSDTQETYYSYPSGGAGWAYADDEGLTKDSNRTWSQWRGYEKVTTTTGNATGPKGKTTTLYYRGLNGEKELDGTPRVETVTTSTGVTTNDDRQLAGFVRETITYNGADEVTGTITDPWTLKTGSHTYTWGTTESWMVKPRTTTTRTKVSTGTRTNAATTYYGTTYGMPVRVDNQGDVAKTGDESCTVTSYARNTAAWIVGTVSRTESYSVGCDDRATMTLPDAAISDVTIGYDGQAVGTAPTKGDATSSYRLSGYVSGQPVYQALSSTTYDQGGRVLTTTDPYGRVERTDYTPSDTAYGPLTSKTVTDPKGFSSSTTIDPAWGLATKLVDANGKTTEWSFDALGRLVAVWKPNRVRTLGDAANITYTYNITNSRTSNSYVRTDTLKADGKTYNSSYQLYDSLLRKRQTQVPSPSGGRLISETLYDDRGLAYMANSQVYDNNAPSGTIAGTLPGSVPASTETVFDGAGRATASIFRVNGQLKWQTATDYSGDEVAVTAAAGGTGIRTITNALGQVTERRQYSGPNPTGAAYTSTKYTYTPRGELAAITGPDKSKWTYTYDLRGRLVTKTDPDSGTTTTTYDDVDQALTTTFTKDGATKTRLNDYDELGRKTGTWDGVKDDAHQLTKYTYDTVAKGKPTAAIRYVGGTTGKIYSQVVTGYDAMGQPTGVKTVLAATDPLVTAGAPQTFTTPTAYNLDGTVQNTVLPAIGGLPIEAVGYTYNDLGMPTGVEGMTDYVRSVGYTQYGETEETVLGTSTTAKQMQVLNRFEDGTRRLANRHTIDQTNAGYTSDVDYTYDDSGNVLSVKNKAGSDDNQCFAYDGERRLTEAWTPASGDCTATRSSATLGGPAPYWHSWTYKVGGLRATQTVHTSGGDTTTTYNYPDVNTDGAGQPHKLTSTVTGSTTTTYGYDELGNTTSRKGPTGATQSLKWNSEGDLASLTESGKATTYLYDANGDLLIRTGPDESVLYLPGGQELHYNPTIQTFSATRYYGIGDGTAVRTNNGLNWIVDDHHGTASLSVDSTTQAVTRRYSKPFGERRGTAPTTWPDDKDFLGKPADDTTGLTHVGAREYDPVIGRFLSVDPVFAPEDHESLNGYAYANNTPVTLADPTGLRPDGACGGTSAYCNGGIETWRLNSHGGWDWTYKKTTNIRGTDGTVLSVTVTQTSWRTTYRATYKIGPSPLPRAIDIDTQQGNATPSPSPGPAPELKKGPAPPLGVAGEILLALCGFVPVIGAGCDAVDLARSVSKGDKLGMALGTAGFVPLIGDAVKLPRQLDNIWNVIRKVDCKCFLAGTRILMANGTVKPIEQIKVGDLVRATDPRTGKTANRKVSRLIVTTDDKHFNKLSIATKTGIVPLTATHEHPFWSPSNNAWVEARFLATGMTLRTVAGSPAIVVANQPFTRHATTYNFTVADLHTYYVLAGETPVLVHNTTCPVGFTNLGGNKFQSPGGLIYGPGSVHGHRLDHVMAHAAPDPTKPSHSMFMDSDQASIVSLLDEGWARRGAPDPNDPAKYIVPMGRVVGTAGEMNLRIVVVPGTSKVITAFPQQ
ncbi:RHS repeat-associated core domain-containing protein [Streptomyces sp. NPDC093225]|uniref:RHS repeat-associated core domain-containing protein n=1 Tax=Streptomyces sp. NPDC093225 TaxID=3366034 RepID=UPI00381E2264